MRHPWRSERERKTTRSIPVLGLLLTLCSCSMPDLPDITMDKQPQRANMNGGPFFDTKRDDHANFAPGGGLGSNTYLATVRIQYSDTSVPVSFDIHRNRADFMSLNMQQSQTTSTSLHLGYTGSEGAMAGLRFIWRF